MTELEELQAKHQRGSSPETAKVKRTESQSPPLNRERRNLGSSIKGHRGSGGSFK